MRRIGVLSGLAEGDPEARRRALSFENGLRDLGWIKGRNLQIESRWAGDGRLLARYAAELVALAPELILANTTPVVTALHEQTRKVPIVFVQVTDPVGEGFVASLAHPGGNITGITNFEFSIGSKWLEILKEISPRVARVAIVFNPETAPFADLLIQPIKAAAASFAITATLASARGPSELERVIDDFAREPNGALLVLPDVSAVNHRDRDHRSGCAPALAGDLSVQALCGKRRARFIRLGRGGHLSADRVLRRPDPARHAAGRYSGGGADEIRAGHQSPERKGTPA